jgi:4-hydroxy-tetrahydrodipicolinate synthase
MNNPSSISGVYAAVVTPLKADLTPDIEGLFRLLKFLTERGCHGILLLGTTGEGPSFSREERLLLYQAAVDVRQNLPQLCFLAGTGTPSLEDTVFLTHSAFDLGFDGVVILPPYYYRKADDVGLFAWFSQLLGKAVPEGGITLGYHIPNVSGVGFSLDLLSRLKDVYPTKFTGIKDSSADPEWAQALGERFGSDLVVLNGNDRLFSLALQSGASGCITAMANLLSPLHRQVWDQFQAGAKDEIAQDKLTATREILDRYPPMPPIIKMLLHRLHGFDLWKVKPPLNDFAPGQAEVLLSEFLASLD